MDVNFYVLIKLNFQIRSRFILVLEFFRNNVYIPSIYWNCWQAIFCSKACCFSSVDVILFYHNWWQRRIQSFGNSKYEISQLETKQLAFFYLTIFLNIIENSLIKVWVVNNLSLQISQSASSLLYWSDTESIQSLSLISCPLTSKIGYYDIQSWLVRCWTLWSESWKLYLFIKIMSTPNSWGI